MMKIRLRSFMLILMSSVLLLTSCGSERAASSVDVQTTSPAVTISAEPTQTANADPITEVQTATSDDTVSAEPTGSLSGDPNSIKYQLEDYTIYLPEEWKGHYTIATDGYSVSVYSTANMYAGHGGSIFNLACAEDDLTSLGTGVLSAIQFVHGKYLIMSEHSSEPPGEQEQYLQDEYYFLAKDIDEILSNIIIRPEDDFHYAYQTEYTVKDDVGVYYPRFTDLDEMQDGVNKLIQDAALECVDDFDKNFSYPYSLYYRVKYNSNGLISIVFDEVEGSGAHYLYTVNIDVEKQAVIGLRDILNVNDELINILKTGTTACTEPWGTEQTYSEIVLGKSTDDWMTQLQGADQYNHAYANTYFTQEALVISVPGNDMVSHVEISVSYKDLEQLKINNVVREMVLPDL